MTIQEAIRARIDRFNRLYLAAVGHSFEDDPKWCAEQTSKELPVWEEKVNSRLKELNLASLDEYFSKYYTDGERLPQDPIIDDLLNKKPRYSSLYIYEEGVMEQARAIAEWFEAQGNPKELWDSLPHDLYQFVETIKEKGFDKWDDGHSGNSAGMSVLFASFLLFKRELFPYLHGALAPLVGDEGYHDDRADVELALKQLGVNSNE